MRNCTLQTLVLRTYSTNSRTLESIPTTFVEGKLDPWFITGFADGEGCFCIEIRKSHECKVGFVVMCGFYVVLHKKKIGLYSNSFNYI